MITTYDLKEGDLHSNFRCYHCTASTPLPIGTTMFDFWRCKWCGKVNGPIIADNPTVVTLDTTIVDSIKTNVSDEV